MTLFTDDLLNGGQVTDKTSFFSGLNMLKGDLGTLDTNLGTIQTQINDLIDSNTATSASLVQSNDIEAIRL
jgi:regulator of replication initiation timing